MQKILLISMILLWAFLMTPCYADITTNMTVAQLVENGKSLDGSEVTLTVEAIGDLMKRGKSAWVNGLDSTAAIGLWMPAEMTSDIKILGSGKFKGDTFQVRGIFNRACREHGGDMDIHVTHMEKTAPGYRVDQSLSKTRVTAAVFLTVMVGLLGGFYLKGRRR